MSDDTTTAVNLSGGVPHLLRAICPLFILDDRGWPVPIGTGVLLAIVDARLVLTSAHVVDLIPPAEVLTAYSFVWGKLAALRGDGSFTKLPASGNREEDRADLAFFRLLPEIADGLTQQLAFWPVEHVAVGLDAVRDTHYTFSGYPHRDSGPRGKDVIRADPLPLTAGAYADADYERVGVNSRTHIGIRLEGGPLLNENGQLHSKHPNLYSICNGMSGGAVWKGYKRMLDGEAVTPKLVGLCMELPPQYPESFLGVRMTPVLEGIRARFPDLTVHIPHDPDLEVVSRR